MEEKVKYYFWSLQTKSQAILLTSVSFNEITSSLP